MTEIFNGFLRLSNFPLDKSSVFSNLIDATNYAANNKTAYAGQLIAVINEDAKDVAIYTLTFPSEGSSARFILVEIITTVDVLN
jgi:hypothetical protein